MKRLNCPLCRSEKRKFFEKYKRWNDLNIHICKNCGFVYSELVPDNVHLLEEQQEFDYSRNVFDKEKHLFFMLLKSKIKKGQRYRQIIEEIEKICNKFNLKHSNILDVGCSVGTFLDYIHEYDKDIVTYGLDIYPDICKFTNKRHKVYCGTLEYLKQYENIKFDIISYLEVFEHIPEPYKELKMVREILNNDGLLILELPNLWYSYIKGKIEKNILFKKIFNIEEWGLMPNIHYNHFSPKSVKNFLTKSGFSVKKIIPSTHIRYVGEDTPNLFLYFIYVFYSIFSTFVFKLTGIVISCNFIVFAIKNK